MHSPEKKKNKNQKTSEKALKMIRYFSNLVGPLQMWSEVTNSNSPLQFTRTGRAVRKESYLLDLRS